MRFNVLAATVSEEIHGERGAEQLQGLGDNVSVLCFTAREESKYLGHQACHVRKGVAGEEPRRRRRGEVAARRRGLLRGI